MHLELLVEEPSVEAFLRVVLPRFIRPGTTFEIYPFNGKFDLLNKLLSRLRGYKRWIENTDTVILILVDRDDEDCRQIKQSISAIIKQSGLQEKSSSPDGWRVATRIICEELEAWYFGDWEAVRLAYPEVPPTIPNRAAFRNSDDIKGGTWEAFERVLNGSRYYRGGLPKIESARSVAEYFDAHRCSSPSWVAFRELTSEL